MRTAYALIALALAGSAAAQLKPTRLYNGVDRPLTVDVRGDGEVLWLDADGRNLGAARVRNGRQDIAKAIPDLWKSKPAKVTYLQFARDGKRRGPALVLQPMVSPTLSRLAADGRTVEFVPDEDQAFSGYRVYLDQHLRLETSMGDMEFRLRPDAAPNTAFTIMELVRGGLYENTIWHRVVAKRQDGTPFVIQGGDPSGTGSGGPGFAYALEKSTLPHTFGVISIARSTDPNTNGCQLFVGLSREGTQHLDGRYAAFGEMVKGSETLLEIAKVPVGEADRPVNPPRIKRARLVDAPPRGEGPKPLLRPAGYANGLS